MKLLRWTFGHAFSILVFLAIPGCASAQSQHPTEQTRASQTEISPRGATESSLIVEIQPPSQGGQETAKQQHKEDADAFQKNATLILNVVTVVVLFLQLVVLGFQNRIFSRQAEIFDGQRDLASQQNKIGRRQNRILESQRILMEGQLSATAKSAEAAKTSADAAVMAVEHADRPWIRVYFTPETLVVSDAEGLVITCRVTVKNVGKSVAEQVLIWNYLAVDPSTLNAEQEKLREYFDRPELIKTMGGMTIFPDEEKTQTHTVGTGKEPPETFWREKLPDMLGRPLDDRILPLTYIGCIGYRYGTSTKWHFTYWGYDVVASTGLHLAVHIATGKLPQPPYLREPPIGNLNRAT